MARQTPRESKTQKKKRARAAARTIDDNHGNWDAAIDVAVCDVEQLALIAVPVLAGDKSCSESRHRRRVADGVGVLLEQGEERVRVRGVVDGVAGRRGDPHVNGFRRGRVER